MYSRPEPEWWWRRPRPPLTGFLAVDIGPFNGKFAAFLMLVILGMWGFGTARLEGQWWAACARRHLRCLGARSDRGPDRVSAPARVRDVRGRYSRAMGPTLARTGSVEIGLARPRMAFTLVFLTAIIALGVGLVVFVHSLRGVSAGVACVGVLGSQGLIPHLELATGRGPALRVDAQGVRLARWVPLVIPWSQIVSVTTERAMSTVVETSEQFEEAYRRSRPLLLRATRGGPGRSGRSGYAIAGTVDAHPAALTAWLAYEAKRHRD